MLHRIKLLFISCLVIGGVFFAVNAQDDNADVTTTLEEVTSTSADFYGETVVLEGTVIDFLNVATIVLGEDATLDSDQVLLINNTGRHFPLNIFRDERVAVRGVVHPSIEVRESEDIDVDTEADMTEGVEAETTTEAENMEDADMEEDMDDTDMATDEETENIPQEPVDDASDLEDADNEDMDDAEDSDMEDADMDDADMNEVEIDHQNAVDFYYAGNFDDDYDIYTIIEVTSIEDIEVTADE